MRKNTLESFISNYHLIAYDLNKARVGHASSVLLA